MYPSRTTSRQRKADDETERRRGATIFQRSVTLESLRWTGECSPEGYFVGGRRKASWYEAKAIYII